MEIETLLPPSSLVVRDSNALFTLFKETDILNEYSAKNISWDSNENTEVEKSSVSIKKETESTIYNGDVNLENKKTVNKIDINQFDKNGFIAYQKWVGYITHISDTYLTARLIDKTQGGTEEITKIMKVDIPEDELKGIVVGSIFYLTIGKENRSGQIENKEIIRFKRTPKISTSILNQMNKKAEERSKGAFLE